MPSAELKDLLNCGAKNVITTCLAFIPACYSIVADPNSGRICDCQARDCNSFIRRKMMMLSAGLECLGFGRAEM